MNILNTSKPIYIYIKYSQPLQIPSPFYNRSTGFTLKWPPVITMVIIHCKIYDDRSAWYGSDESTYIQAANPYQSF